MDPTLIIVKDLDRLYRCGGDRGAALRTPAPYRCLAVIHVPKVGGDSGIAGLGNFCNLSEFDDHEKTPCVDVSDMAAVSDSNFNVHLYCILRQGCCPRKVALESSKISKDWTMSGTLMPPADT
jgi:hypothetical protein